MAAVTHATSAHGDVCVVELIGEVDMAHSEQVTEWLCTAVDRCGGEVLDVDLSQTLFVDSTAITALVTAQAYAREHGMVMRCSNPQPVVLRIFDIVGVTEHLGIAGQGGACRR